MRFPVRITLLALLACTLAALSAPAAHASFGIERFISVTCNEESKGECGEELLGPFGILGTFSFPPPGETPISVKEAEEEGFTQAGGHVPFGVTAFKVNTTGEPPEAKPEGVVAHIRTDVAAGLATSPAAVPQCTEAEFGTEALPTLFLAPSCKPETQIGINKAVVYIPEAGKDVALEGKVFNLIQRPGLASLFGVALEIPKFITEPELKKIFKGSNPEVEKEQYFAHTLIEGNVEWGSNVTLSRKSETGTGVADYHDFFEIEVSTTLPLIASRLVFFGNREHEVEGVSRGDFITNATSCPGHNTTILKLTDTEGHTVPRAYPTPIGLSGCNLVRFEPSFAVKPETTAHDTPDGFATELGLARHPRSKEVDSSQLKTAVIQLPEGMTMNPSAAAGLSACTPAQAHITSNAPGVGCPASSQIGTVGLEVPTLPPGAFTGALYLGGPESEPITGPPYTVYLDAESKPFGVSVRLRGEAIPNELTGQVTVVFAENPEQPFTNVTVKLKEGALAPIANPLQCGTATTLASLTPFSQQSPTRTPTSAFSVDNEGKGGACPSPLPFAPVQSTQKQSPKGGGHTSYTFDLIRSDGQPYLEKLRAVLPAGLVGALPTVTKCEEPQAREGRCPVTSQIGAATVQVGAGPIPYTLPGSVYLTGPYAGAPFGLSTVVPAIAGPFNLGLVVTRSRIDVDQFSARVIATTVLPTIVKGVPVRLRHINVAVNKQGFLFNPTNCGPLATETTVTGFVTPLGAAVTSPLLSSPFQLGECDKLAFTPRFRAASSARTSKANGAGLETTIDQPSGQANIKSVTVTLPKALPSRLTTLQQACLAATFEVNPYNCPKGSFVGGVRANTPTLRAKLKGPAILVSHANEAFPDLDLLLEGEGVRVILVGNTDIKKGITKTTFASTPDVPVSSVTVNLPTGPHSALAANTDLCAHPLIMPTSIVGQNGKTVKLNTRIRVKSCGVRIVGRKVVGRTLYLTVRTFLAGRISGKGRGLSTVFRRLRHASSRATLKVHLSRVGLRRHRPFSVRVRVGFLPSNRHERPSVAFATVRFR
jgi:hypothetical protein